MWVCPLTCVRNSMQTVWGPHAMSSKRCRMQALLFRWFTPQAHSWRWVRAETHSVVCMLERGWAIANFGNLQRLNWRWSRSKRLDGCACNPAISSAIICSTSFAAGAIAEQQVCSRRRESPAGEARVSEHKVDRESRGHRRSSKSCLNLRASGEKESHPCGVSALCPPKRQVAAGASSRSVRWS